MDRVRSKRTVTSRRSRVQRRGKVWGGIDLGGTKIEAVVIDGHGKPIGHARHPTPTQGEPEDVVREMYGALEEAVQTAGLHGGLRGARKHGARGAQGRGEG
ncbi:hypothetical protein [Myxococcus sp. AB025B]|uniref:hypothetical protein n=1 Tax=Myxococcus sp. AB025B TaxID=2562794 RepID=UPI001E512006|nr:hypothetical protein [Myxococcus sp. AB025B]